MNQGITITAHPSPRRCSRLAIVAVLGLSAAAGSAALGGTPVVVDVNISDIPHLDVQGSPENMVLEVSVPAGAVIQGVGWSGTLITEGESWASDATISISDGSADRRDFVPGDGDFEPRPLPGSFYTTNGIVQFGSMQQPGYPVSGGTVYIEFWDEFIDNPGSAEASWGPSSTFSIEYVVMDFSDCPADISGDSVVDVSDLLALLSAWGPCTKGGCPADISGDDVVDVSDLLALLSGWGACPPGGPLASACCLEDGSCLDLTEDECASMGRTYQGDFTQCSSWTCPQPPNGHTCEDALEIEIDGPTVSGDTTGSTPPEGLPLCQPAGLPSSNTGIMWYTVVGDGTTLRASTCESEIETFIAVYCSQGCDTDSMSCIASSSDGNCDNPFKGEVSWCSAPQRTYLVAVWGWPNSYGEVSLSVESGNACSNPLPCELPCDGHCGSMSPAYKHR